MNLQNLMLSIGMARLWGLLASQSPICVRGFIARALRSREVSFSCPEKQEELSTVIDRDEDT